MKYLPIDMGHLHSLTRDMWYNNPDYILHLERVRMLEILSEIEIVDKHDIYEWMCDLELVLL